MSQRALKPAPEVTEVPETDRPRAESPATRLLDAMRAGDDAAILGACAETTAVSAENMSWSALGPDEIGRMLAVARQRFPGLTFESRTRHVGFGLVIEEARVQDSAFEATLDEDEQPGRALDSDHPDDDRPHPMWDEPATERRTALSVWRDRTTVDEPAVALNMPVRVTVRHDDLQIHEVTLGFPAALLKRALGLRVDPFEMSLSEVQSAFIAPVGAGFTTHTLVGRDIPLAPPRAADPTPAVRPIAEPPRRRRGRLLLPLLLVVLALGGGAAWFAVQGSPAADVSGSPGVSQSPDPSTSTTPSTSPSSSPSSSQTPQVTQSQPTGGPTRAPNVTLTSDLAFAFNSAELSAPAKARIANVARQVLRAGLTGKIFVDGYTDNLGDATYGLDLSRRRATAVAGFLQTQLLGAPVSIVAIGHGEADPVASNATADGRVQNRRVTITLPKP